MTEPENLQAVLNEPEQSIRLGVFNAERHSEEKAFKQWENKEPNCTRGMLIAYHGMVANADKPLSREIIDDIRSKLYQNGETPYSTTTSLKTSEDLKKTNAELFKERRAKVAHTTSFGIPSASMEEKKQFVKDAEDLRKSFNGKNPPYLYTEGIGLVQGGIETEHYYPKIIERYNNEMSRSNISSDDKLTSIITLTRDLERSHPYTDFNCRTFCVLILNRELTKNGFSASLMEDPNVFDYKSLGDLKSLVKQGQENFRNLELTGKAHERDATNEQWLASIPKDKEHIRQEFHKVTFGIYSETASAALPKLEINSSGKTDKEEDKFKPGTSKAAGSVNDTMPAFLKDRPDLQNQVKEIMSGLSGVKISNVSSNAPGRTIQRSNSLNYISSLPKDKKGGGITH